jgi:hypothetical protein
MMLWDLIAAMENEGFDGGFFEQFRPKSARYELDGLHQTFGDRIYREAIWDERAKNSVRPPERVLIGWPVRRAGNVIRFRQRDDLEAAGNGMGLR